MIRGIGFRLQLSSSAAAIFPLKCKTNILSGKGFEARKKIEDKDSLESEREKTWSAQCVWVRDREREKRICVCSHYLAKIQLTYVTSCDKDKIGRAKIKQISKF